MKLMSTCQCLPSDLKWLKSLGKMVNLWLTLILILIIAEAQCQWAVALWLRTFGLELKLLTTLPLLLMKRSCSYNWTRFSHYWHGYEAYCLWCSWHGYKTWCHFWCQTDCLLKCWNTLRRQDTITEFTLFGHLKVANSLRIVNFFVVSLPVSILI